MADVVETSEPPAVDQTGHLTIWWVPTIADVLAPTVAEIGAGSRLTHSFTPDGWGLTGTQEKTPDPRLTKRQILETLGATSKSLTLKYVDSSTSGSAAVVLEEGLIGFFVERRNVAQTELAETADLVRVLPATLGEQIPGPADGSGKFLYMQETALGTVTPPVALV